MRKLSKLTVAAAFLLSVGLSATANAEVDHPFDTDMVGQWKFNEGAGIVATDSVDSNDGVISGGAVYTSAADAAPLPFNPHALSFDGIDDVVTVANDTALDVTSAYTLSAWVYVDTAGGYRPILFRGAPGANDIEVYVQAASDDLIVAHNRDNGGGFDFVGFADPPNGSWFHLAVTYDGTDVVAYYDGVPAGVTQNTTAMSAPVDTDKPWWMGKVDHPAFGGINLLTGRLDDVRIYDVALTAEQVETLFNGILEIEEIYAVDAQENDGEDGSLLFKVNLAPGPGQAIYTQLEIDECRVDGIDAANNAEEQDCIDNDRLPMELFDRVEGLAATPDGARLYVVDRNTAALGYYEFATKIFQFVAAVSDGGDIDTLIELAFGPDGTLYGVRGGNENLYCINPLTAVAVSAGIVTETTSGNPINISGGDLAITATNDGFIWTNGSGGVGEPAGLYSVDLTCAGAGGVVDAVTLGPVDADLFRFNGLAIRFNGLDGIVGSENLDDMVYPIDDTDGSVDTVGGLVVTGDVPSDDLRTGDLSNGQLALCQARSKGYYKTHIDANGKKDIDTDGVTICGNNQDDATIEEILSDAKGKNFSMLAAQTITAILNCDLINDGEWNDDCDRSGYPSIAAAEDFLCNAIPSTAAPDWWTQEFDDQEEKSDANSHAGIMDAFNNQGHGGFCALLTDGEEKDGNGPPT